MSFCSPLNTGVIVQTFALVVKANRITIRRKLIVDIEEGVREIELDLYWYALSYISERVDTDNRLFAVLLFCCEFPDYVLGISLRGETCVVLFHACQLSPN